MTKLIQFITNNLLTATFCQAAPTTEENKPGANRCLKPSGLSLQAMVTSK